MLTSAIGVYCSIFTVWTQTFVSESFTFLVIKVLLLPANKPIQELWQWSSVYITALLLLRTHHRGREGWSLLIWFVFSKVFKAQVQSDRIYHHVFSVSSLPPCTWPSEFLWVCIHLPLTLLRPHPVWSTSLKVPSSNAVTIRYIWR